MSLTKSATRRLPLLATTSLSIACMATAASLSMLALPSAAVAAQNPCGTNPATNGAAPDVIVCPVATYGTGVEHTSQGDLDLTVQLGSSFGTGGVVTEAGLVQDDLIVRLTGTATAATTNFSTAFPILFDIESQAGDILFDANVPRNTGQNATLAASNAASTHFLRAVSTAGGDVTVTRSGGTGNLQATGTGGYAAIEARSEGGGDVTVRANGNGRQYGILTSVNSGGSILITGNGTANATAGHTGIEAISTSGNGNVTIGQPGARVTGSGRLYGIHAQTTGTGDLSIYAGGSTGSGSGSGSISGSVDAVAAIHATTASGDMIIDTTGGAVTAGAWGNAVRTIAGGSASITLGEVAVDRPAFDIARDAAIIHNTAAAGTTTTLNLTGFTRADRGLQVTDLALQGDGAGEIDVNISNVLYGRMDFSDLGGGVEINIASGGEWTTYGASELSGSDDAFTIAAGGMFAPGAITVSRDGGFGNIFVGDLGQGDETFREISTVQFGAGDDTLVNAGILAVGYGRYGHDRPFAQVVTDRLEVDLHLLGLETFENTGSIFFGLHSAFPGSTDGRADDVLIMPGTNFIGSGDSTLLLDVNLNATQASCDPALRDPVLFDMPAADCISMPGGSTSGVTKVLIKEQFPFDRGAYTATGVALVDVAGGTGATGDFVIHEDSVGYSSLYGGSIDKGVFAYALVFDGETQQHKLVAAPTGNVLQYPLLAQAAHGIWRQSTGAWFDRQAEIRSARDEVGGGVWLRVSTEFADRNLVQNVEVAGNPFDIDNTHKQSTFAVTTGVDVITGDAGPVFYVLGAMGGYTNSKVEFDTSPNRAQFDGYVAGLYGGVVSGGFFADAALTGNKLIMDHDVPGFGLLPEGTITSTDLTTYGAQAEAGWRFPVIAGVFVEPLAAVSYTTAKFDDLLIVAADASRQGVEVMWEDPKSLRASVGGRFGLEQDYAGYRAQYTLLGRVWNEFEDETAVVLAGQGDPAPLFNEFSGVFSELGVGASLHNLSGAVSGFFNFGSRFADDYNAVTGALGMRVAW